MLLPIKYIPLFHCPFCSESKGHIVLDVEACGDARSEDPSECYLDRHRMEDRQDLICSGRSPTGWQPCRHLLHAAGQIHWNFSRGGGCRENDDSEYDATLWRIDFHWVAQGLLAPDLTHAGPWLTNFEKIRRSRPALLPDVPFAWEPCIQFYQPDDDTRRVTGLVEINTRFLVASKPVRFLKELKAKAYEYNALRKKRREKKNKKRG